MYSISLIVDQDWVARLEYIDSDDMVRKLKCFFPEYRVLDDAFKVHRIKYKHMIFKSVVELCEAIYY